MIFRPQGRQSKQAGGYFPSATDAKEDCMDDIFRPCGRKSTHGAIFRPQRWKIASMQLPLRL